jgi:hypothetical protein
MTDELRVLLEIGPKGKRVVASAMDWPGLERWGRTEDEAVDPLLAYVPRYAPVAQRVGRRSEFECGSQPHILERTPGNTSTDWWGIAHVPSVVEADPMTDDELERRIGIMRRHGRSSTTRQGPATHPWSAARAVAGASGIRSSGTSTRRNVTTSGARSASARAMR